MSLFRCVSPPGLKQRAQQSHVYKAKPRSFSKAAQSKSVLRDLLCELGQPAR